MGKLATAVVLLSLPLSASAAEVLLRDAVPAAGGTVSLNASNSYHQGLSLEPGTATVIEGNGAVIDLGTGSLRKISVESNASLTIRNASIRNGEGITAGSHATILLENVVMEDMTVGVQSSAGSTVTISNSVIRRATTHALNAGGGSLTLTKLDIPFGGGILLHGGVIAEYRGGVIGAGSTPAFNLASGGVPSTLSLDDVVMRDRPHGIYGTNFKSVTVRSSEFVNCRRGIELFEAPGGSVFVDSSHFDARDLESNAIARSEGLEFRNLASATIRNTTITEMRSGIVLHRLPSAIVEGTQVLSCLRHQIALTYVQSATMEGITLRSAFGGDAVDALRAEHSTLSIRDAMILDSPANGITAVGARLAVSRTFVAGAQGAGIEGLSSSFQPTLIDVSDSTIVSGGYYGIRVDSGSRLTAQRNIATQASSASYWPSLRVPRSSDAAGGTLIDSTGLETRILNSFLHLPAEQAIRIGKVPPAGSSEVRHSTILGTGEDLVGAGYSDAGMSNDFTDNHVTVTGSNAVNVDVSGRTALSGMHGNSLGSGGVTGIAHNAVGPTNAVDNYFGSSTGPAGIHDGKGSRVLGSAITVVPFLEEAPISSSSALMPVSMTGSGSTMVATENLLVGISYNGNPPLRPGTEIPVLFDAIVGISEYLRSETIENLPDVVHGEIRFPLNLWLDNRLYQYLTDETGHYLELSFMPATDGRIIHSAELRWETPQGIASVEADNIQRDGEASRAIFRFRGKAEFPTSTMTLSLHFTEKEKTSTGYSADWFLAEGATFPGFDTFVLMANPHDEEISVGIDFLTSSGENRSTTRTITARSRATIKVNDYAPNQAVSVVLRESKGRGFGVERAMYTTGPGGRWYGGHTAVGVAQPMNSWLLPEGSAGLAGPAGKPFETYILIANPEDEPVTVTVTFFVEGSQPFSRTEIIPANARHTILANGGYDPRLHEQSFATRVTAEPGRNIIVERAMWWNDANWSAGNFMEGHASPGITGLSQAWFLAEGQSGPEFDEFLLILNPSSFFTTVTIRYLMEDEASVVRILQMAPNQRRTINVRWDEEGGLGRSVRHGTVVTANRPIAVERSMYRSEAGVGWIAGHNSLAAPEAAYAWGLPEGATVPITVGTLRTDILVANPQEIAAKVTLYFLMDDGTNVEKAYTIPPHRRLTVRTNDLPELASAAFSTLATSDHPIVVERSMYWGLDAPVEAEIAGATCSMGIPLAVTRDQLDSLDLQEVKHALQPLKWATPTPTPSTTPTPVR